MHGPLAGIALGAALRVLAVVLLVGAVFHEGAPARAALLHAGDWLIKPVVMATLVGTFE